MSQKKCVWGSCHSLSILHWFYFLHLKFHQLDSLLFVLVLENSNTVARSVGRACIWTSVTGCGTQSRTSQPKTEKHKDREFKSNIGLKNNSDSNPNPDHSYIITIQSFILEEVKYLWLGFNSWICTSIQLSFLTKVTGIDH